MMAFLNSVNDLSISANELNTSEEFYNINIGGIPYGIDIASSETRIGVDCKEGHVQSTLFCGNLYTNEFCCDDNNVLIFTFTMRSMNYCNFTFNKHISLVSYNLF